MTILRPWLMMSLVSIELSIAVSEFRDRAHQTAARREAILHCSRKYHPYRS